MFVEPAYKARGAFPECTSLFCPAWGRALFSSVWVAASSLPRRATSLKAAPDPDPRAKGGLFGPLAGGITDLRGANPASSLGIETRDEGTKVA